MHSYRYLIVGGGMTADAACRGIRDHDGDGSIGLVSAETHPPYNRPPLSKALWQGKDESSDEFKKMRADFQNFRPKEMLATGPFKIDQACWVRGSTAFSKSEP